MVIINVCSLKGHLTIHTTYILFQEPQEGIDERCPHANGLFDHDDPGICDKYLSCDNGIAHELPCVPRYLHH